MFDHAIRGFKDRLLTPIARRCSFLHPTTVTMLAFVVGLISASFIVQQSYIAGLTLWLLNRLLDGLDGTMARINNLQSDLGGYIDIMLDFVVYALIPIAITVSRPSMANYASLAFLLACFYINSASWMYLASILEKRRQGAETKGELTTINMPNGLIAGTETVIIFCMFILWSQYIVYLFIGMGLLVLVTIAQRLRWATHHLKE